MTISPGGVIITGISGDVDTAGTGNDELISIVATENIAAGEVIVFHNPESTGDNAFSFTVGPNGLLAGDRVTFAENGNVHTLINDPSGANAATDVATTIGSWSISGAGDNIIITSFDPVSGNNVVIAACNIDDNGGVATAWNDNIGLIANVDATGILGLSPSPIIELTNSSGMYAGSTFTDVGNPAFWSVSDLGVDYFNANIGGTTYASQDATILCFVEGTLIATPDGERKVEDLEIGDVVITAAGKSVAVKWLGVQTVRNRSVSERNQPVRLRAGALGGDIPHSDLTVSADHGMIVDGLVINASALVNGTTIEFVPLAEMPDTFAYYHIETEAHDVILANGAESETFIDYVGRAAFDNAAQYLELYGAERIIPEMNRTRISSRRLVPATIKAKLGVGNEVFDFDMGRSA